AGIPQPADPLYPERQECPSLFCEPRHQRTDDFFAESAAAVPGIYGNNLPDSAELPADKEDPDWWDLFPVQLRVQLPPAFWPLVFSTEAGQEPADNSLPDPPS